MEVVSVKLMYLCHVLHRLTRGTWGVTVLRYRAFFFMRHFGNFNFKVKCGIAVSSSSAVFGFSSFWLTVFGEIRLFTVLRYLLF